ncbi:DEAD/DEAH box helicase [Gordonia sp. CPCC 205333]
MANVGTDDRSASLRTWQTLAADVDAQAPLPTAAHAVPDALGTSIISADYASTTLRDTLRLGTTLEDQVRAELRGYQVRGVGFILDAVGHSGGAVLADEMGLGKTLQAIAFLVHQAPATSSPALVVCPTSLVTNWLREIKHFAPQLNPIGYRGGDLETPDDCSVVVTGYPTLRGHHEVLTQRHWSATIFDEAQFLKNHRTQVSKAARALDSDARIALTGTPVENHLDELWSLLNLVARKQFSNRALFRRRFTLPIGQGSPEAMRRMRATIAPIVLGRSKSQVATSLPAKLHTDVACDLTDEQATRYDQLLAAAIDEGFGLGTQRHGRILATLTRLKQVCNHPVLASTTPTWHADHLAGRSGKLDACSDIVGTNLENDSPTIIFTQYRETGELLRAYLADQFDVAVPFLHGGLRRSHRDSIVDDYQAGKGSGLLIASLKAAGTGLTLTRAADVVHFDRWWNPAVQAQASDRVHRIGQTRTVTITTLTTAGTIEEHIAAMHERKSALALDSDASALTALTSLSDEGLVEVLRRTREEDPR